MMSFTHLLILSQPHIPYPYPYRHLPDQYPYIPYQPQTPYQFHTPYQPLTPYQHPHVWLISKNKPCHRFLDLQGVRALATSAIKGSRSIGGESHAGQLRHSDRSSGEDFSMKIHSRIFNLNETFPNNVSPNKDFTNRESSPMLTNFKHSTVFFNYDCTI